MQLHCITINITTTVLVLNVIFIIFPTPVTGTKADQYLSNNILLLHGSAATDNMQHRKSFHKATQKWGGGIILKLDV